MKVVFEYDRLVVWPESAVERIGFNSWKGEATVFSCMTDDQSYPGATLFVPDVESAEPVNVTILSPHPVRLIANFAPIPFRFDEQDYACVESFWQSLRFPLEDRSRIAAMDGSAAKRESERQPYPLQVAYAGRMITVGTYEHWQLMHRACLAKFQQNENARLALLGTGNRRLVHRIEPDSRTIPGVIMADIWMTLRESFQRGQR